MTYSFSLHIQIMAQTMAAYTQVFRSLLSLEIRALPKRPGGACRDRHRARRRRPLRGLSDPERRCG